MRCLRSKESAMLWGGSAISCNLTSDALLLRQLAGAWLIKLLRWRGRRHSDGDVRRWIQGAASSRLYLANPGVANVSRSAVPVVSGRPCAAGIGDERADRPAAR